MKRAGVVIARGHQVTPWELRPWELLPDRFDVSYLETRRNRFDSRSLALEARPVRTRSDLLPGRLGSAPIRDSYVGLERVLSEAAIVHSQELYPWFAAQPAELRPSARWKLVVTVWETIPMMRTYRTARARRNRERVIAATDMFLPATERARDCLLLEGVPEERIEVVHPGIDVERFARTAERRHDVDDEPIIISPARLVWEKGHHDLLRAIAALERGMAGPPIRARALIVGAGAEGQRLQAYAHELGIDGRVEIKSQVPYEQMPSLYARASCLVLASLPRASSIAPTRPPALFWEEQFGYVLAEAIAAGLPIVASDSGAIPEVVAGSADLFAAGDWLGLARKLAAGPLAKSAGGARPYPPELVERYSLEGTARRLADVYDRLLAG
jgi:glycosyltransferase involved in cell wall biosynthesis